MRKHLPSRRAVLTGALAACAPLGAVGEVFAAQVGGAVLGATPLWPGAQRTLDRIRLAEHRASLSNPENGRLAAGVTGWAAPVADLTLVLKGYHGNENLFAITGGRPYAVGHGVVVRTNNVMSDIGNLAGRFPSAALANQGESAVSAFCIKFITDAMRLEYHVTADPGTFGRVRVNGELVSRDGFEHGQYAYSTLQFATREPRRITLELHGPMQFHGISVDRPASVWAPDLRGCVRGAVTGDSYAEGYIGIRSRGYASLSAIAARLLGIKDLRIEAVGATGYLATGGKLKRRKILDQMSDWIDDGELDYVMFFGGFNDANSNFEPAAVAEEALRCWNYARARQKNAFIVIGGVWAGRLAGDKRREAVEQALHKAFLEWSDPFSLFIPIVGDTPPWTFGSGTDASPTGDGNADLYISSDTLHLNAAGHEYHGHRIAAAVSASLAQY